MEDLMSNDKDLDFSLSKMRSYWGILKRKVWQDLIIFWKDCSGCCVENRQKHHVGARVKTKTSAVIIEIAQVRDDGVQDQTASFETSINQSDSH